MRSVYNSIILFRDIIWYKQWNTAGWKVIWARADYRLGPSHWDTSSQSNAVSHWLGGNLQSAVSDADLPLSTAIPDRSRSNRRLEIHLVAICLITCGRVWHGCPEFWHFRLQPFFQEHAFVWQLITCNRLICKIVDYYGVWCNFKIISNSTTSLFCANKVLNILMHIGRQLCTSPTQSYNIFVWVIYMKNI